MSDEVDEILEELKRRDRHLTWQRVPGADSWVGLNSRGEVESLACGRSEPDPVRLAQDAMETGSQVVGADDEWA